MTRLRDCGLDLLDVVEAVSSNTGVDIGALGLDPELRREILACLPARKRQRKPSIASLIKRAEKTGKTVTSVTTTADGTTINFGEGETGEAETEDTPERIISQL
jgi:hypothetical protein